MEQLVSVLFETKLRSPCESETQGLLRRAVVVARKIIPVGKETDRHWEQGEDPSMLDPKIQIYGSSGKLVVADSFREEGMGEDRIPPINASNQPYSENRPFHPDWQGNSMANHGCVPSWLKFAPEIMRSRTYLAG